MAEEPKPKRVIRPDEPDLTDLVEACNFGCEAVEAHLKAQGRLLEVIGNMPNGPEKNAQIKQFKEIFKQNRALPRWPAREIVGFTAYLQPLATLLLVASVVTVGGSIARDGQNREMCARLYAYGKMGGKSSYARFTKPQIKKLSERLGLPRATSATDELNAWSVL